MPTTNLEIFEKFLNALLHAQKLSAMTVTGYRWKLGQFFRWMAKNRDDKHVTAWTYADFEDFLSAMKWGSPRSQHSLVTKCHRFIRWCNARGGIEGVQVPDFTGGFKVAKVARGKPKCISRAELLALLEGARANVGIYGVRLEVAISLAALAGLRRSECEIVRYCDWDQVKNKLRIESPKTKKVRHVPVSPTLREILLRTHNPARDERLPILHFPSFAGSSGNGNRALRALCKRLGMPSIGFHHLRHTAATLMVRGGVDLATVRDFLGHADLTMTSIYAWSDDEALQSAAAVVL